MKSRTVLFLAADPRDMSRLRLNEEMREIRHQWEKAKHRKQFKFHAHTCIRPRDLTQAMLDVEPNIVHFSRHGKSNGDLCFEDNNGCVKPISPEAIGTLFKQFSDTIECVVLNSCYSEIQAQSISAYIAYVVGMESSIDDQAAIAFSTGFYQALGAGSSVDKAYELGQIQVQLEGLGEHLASVLLRKHPAAA